MAAAGGLDHEQERFEQKSGCHGLLEYRPATQEFLLSDRARDTLGASRTDLSLDRLLGSIIPPDREAVRRLFAEPHRLHDSDVQFRIRHPFGLRQLWLYFNGCRSGGQVIRAWCLDLGA
ncbi:hypothetical protein NFI95_03670 [Acetobacteraceae bacterium KSS8]|uniref:PAS fold-4 domain-containing protein n=1 Tax=Endosaccharibacter trunci TaxID=2812733 RepID=A0ABT1W3V4_9PROT|nr:hypothetical protein [Acetobacteraceae bacterium KSS8]